MNSASKNNFGIQLRAKFPIFNLGSSSPDKPLSYLDTAASGQKPQTVIDRVASYYTNEHANIHRGAYRLSFEATQNFELARDRVRQFIGAKEAESIIFTAGTTASINLIAHSLEAQFQKGDAILLSQLEHHSNIVPWQLLAKRKSLNLVFAVIRPDGTIDIEDLIAKVKQYKPKLVSVTSLSNLLGVVVDVKEIIGVAKECGAWVVVDAAQSVSHHAVNVEELGCDFLAFSGHKLYGPTGLGVLYVRKKLYSVMDPFLGGGGMISTVSENESSWAEPPHKFEAGTPPIAQAIGLHAAIEFIEGLGLSEIASYEGELFAYAYDRLKAESGVTLYGPGPEMKRQNSILSFNVKGAHPHDVATVADSFNVQIRAGHHCAMPALKALGVESCARASLGVYSDKQDIDALLEAIKRTREIFG